MGRLESHMNLLRDIDHSSTSCKVAIADYVRDGGAINLYCAYFMARQSAQSAMKMERLIAVQPADLEMAAPANDCAHLWYSHPVYDHILLCSECAGARTI